jgi:uncharacterized protein
MNKSAAQILRAVHPFARFESVLHGPAHWARVHRFAKVLLRREQVPAEAQTCVLLFAWLHDLAREDDEGTRTHAVDGATQLDRILPAIDEPLSVDQREILRGAIHYHSDGMLAHEAVQAGLFERVTWPTDLVALTVACCWDADRLDLPRVGIAPDPALMSTSSWRDVQLLSARIHGIDLEQLDGTSFPDTSYDPRLSARPRGRA